MPSSVSTLINVVERVFLTPERLNTCPAAGISARSRMVFTSVIFIFHLKDSSFAAPQTTARGRNPRRTSKSKQR